MNVNSDILQKKRSGILLFSSFIIPLIFSAQICAAKELRSSNSEISNVTVGSSSYEIPLSRLTFPNSQLPFVRFSYDYEKNNLNDKDVCDINVIGATFNCYTLNVAITRGGISAQNMASNIHVPAKFKITCHESGLLVTYSTQNPELLYFTGGSGDKFTYFFCIIDLSRADRAGSCVDTFQLKSGNDAQFSFPYNLRDRLSVIERGIDNLMNSYTKKGT